MAFNDAKVLAIENQNKAELLATANQAKAELLAIENQTKIEKLILDLRTDITTGNLGAKPPVDQEAKAKSEKTIAFEQISVLLTSLAVAIAALQKE